MWNKIRNRVWHGWLKRPYILAAPIDKGHGQTVVLLHGIANNHRSWAYTIPHIKAPCRVIALDLLGFGDSPKPDTIEYTPADHARAVAATLRKRGVKRAIIVGHSMGALVAVEVAKRYPKLAKKLILCGVPIYQLNAQQKMLPNQESMYMKLYEQLLRQEALALKAANGFKRLRRDIVYFDLDESNFYAFKKSLMNTIMRQTAYDDIQSIKAPVHFISGRLDLFVIRKHHKTLAGLASEGSFQLMTGPHDLGSRTSREVAEVINASLEGRPVRSGVHARKRRHKKPAMNGQ